MSKKFALVLFAASMLHGSAHAMTVRSSSLSHAHFPTCSEGMVKAICVWTMSRSLLNIAKRSLLRLMLGGVGLASKDAV